MTELDKFKKELAELLDKHSVAIIAKSVNHINDLSVEIGFQFGIRNEWTGRHHLTKHDIN